MLSEAYKRWRHTRGYGVHSPFGYSIIKDVVSPCHIYGYYGYDDLDAAICSHGKERNRKFYRMILRLAAVCDIDSAYLIENADLPVIRRALLGVNTRMEIITERCKINEAEFVISDGDTLEPDILRNHISAPERLLLVTNIPAGWKDELFDSMQEGLMLYGKKNALLISRSDMQKVSYSCAL